MLCGLGRDEARPLSKRSGRARDFGELSRAVHLGLVADTLSPCRMLLPFECLQFFQSAGPLRAEQPR
jgi:hypothetical protein